MAPEESRRFCKTQTFKDGIRMVHPAWLGERLYQKSREQAPENPLFVLDEKVLLRVWKECVKELRLPTSVQYQLRHGGASGDTLSKRRPLLEVMARGRWRSTSSVLRYAKPNQLHKYTRELDDCINKYNEKCLKALEKIMKQTVSPIAVPLPT